MKGCDVFFRVIRWLQKKLFTFGPMDFCLILVASFIVQSHVDLWCVW